MPSVEEHRSDPQADEDARLLRAYADNGSQPAFGALVTRHIDLVHSCALRQCGNDPHQAYDVTQIVFLALAKKAGRIPPQAVLSGWLVRAVHFAAASLRRADRRRRDRERHVAAQRDREAAMQSNQSEPSASDDELWGKMAPLLDGLLARLPSAARDVLVLRFLEGHPYAAIGRRLGVSEQSARKRAQRALDLLRGLLARKGIVTYEEALEAALAGAIAAPVPDAMARAMLASIATTHHHHAAILKGALKLMAWSKAKVAAASIAAALLIGGGGVAVYRWAGPSASTRVVALPDSGQPAAESIRQVPSASPLILRGLVRDAAGRPVAGARVLAAFNQMQFLELSADPQMGAPTSPQAVTGSDGIFEFAVPRKPIGAVVLGPDGAAEASAQALTQTATLTTRPFGRIEGTLLFDHKPVAAGGPLLLSTALLPGHGPQFQMRGRTDRDGRFAIENIPPGEYALFIPNENQNGQIRIAPGMTARVDIDRPAGRTITGRIEGLKAKSPATFLLTERPRSSASQPAGKFAITSWQFDVDVDASGAFKLDHVPTGPAHLSATNIPGQFAVAEKDVEILPPDGQSSGPLDVGTLKLKNY